MNEREWQKTVSEIHDLWGASAKWTSARTAVYEHAADLDYAATKAAIKAYFDEGLKVAPSPSEVITRTRSAGGTIRQAIGACRHPNKAILTYHTDGSAKTGICASCPKELTFTPGQVRTVGDLEERARRRASGEPDTQDRREAEQTEMIAP